MRCPTFVVGQNCSVHKLFYFFLIGFAKFCEVTKFLDVGFDLVKKTLYLSRGPTFFV